GSKTAGVGNIFRPPDCITLQFRQAIDERLPLIGPVGAQPVVLRKIDDFYVRCNGVGLQKFARIAVAYAEEQYVDVTMVGFRKPQVCISEEIVMYVRYLVARIANAMGKRNIHVGMVNKYP